MKELFKQWLINQNSPFINGCGIDCILSKVDDQLKIINANEEETETLQERLVAFMQTVSVFLRSSIISPVEPQPFSPRSVFSLNSVTSTNSGFSTGTNII